VPFLVLWLAGLQAPAPAPPAAARSSPFELAAAWVPRWDQYRYQFSNPSSFGTVQLVPHYFVQSYKADNHWLAVRAQYTVAGQRWLTEAGFAPGIVTQGDDFDTFDQPSGDVVTVGTSGDVTLQSFSVRQRFIAVGHGPVTLVAEYAYRRDRAEFHPADRVETHTMPPSEHREYITTRETTISNVHELRIGPAFAWAIADRWRADLTLTAAPTTFARLVTKLPDKYPGVDIVFDAIVFAAAGEFTLRRAWPAWFVEVGADGERTWSYTADRQFERKGYGVALRAGLRR